MVIAATPLHRSAYATARWLVLAPHPDDETLGTGALIVETAAAGRLAGVVFLTDGAGSHGEQGRRLVDWRRREARLAVRRLAGRGAVPVFLGWHDGQPFAEDSRAFATSARRLAGLIRRLRVDAVAVTAAHEPHCDHAACYRVTRVAIRRARRHVALFDYRVWAPGGTLVARRTIRTRAMPPGLRRHALLAHRSQTTAAFGPGFRLDRAAWRMRGHDILHLNEARYAR